MRAIISMMLVLAACKAGKDGEEGMFGLRGSTGPKGEVGDRGPQGPRGADGAAGARGPAGAPGLDGVAGAMGPVGPVGPAGPEGQVGTTGAIGSVGLPGPQGSVGPVGPAGAAGPAGVAGARGPAGRGDPGCPAPRVNGVCVLSHDNRSQTSFALAAITCAVRGGDICTDSQSWPITIAWQQNIYMGPGVMTTAHWTASFADNDVSNWSGANGGTGDDHGAGSSYGFACCGGTTPTHPRLTPEVVNGVEVLLVHDIADTYWSGAVGQCHALGGDLCSDSQTALLRQAGRLSTTAWTNSHSDNDGNNYTQIVGNGVPDHPHPSHQFGFACCGSTLPLDLSCPVPRTFGVCVTSVRQVPDTSFLNAAQACANTGADLCSTSQLAVLRQFGTINGPMWSNSHSDNDGNNAAVGVGAVADNPNLNTGYGYACCLK